MRASKQTGKSLDIGTYKVRLILAGERKRLVECKQTFDLTTVPIAMLSADLLASIAAVAAVEATKSGKFHTRFDFSCGIFQSKRRSLLFI